MFMDNSPPNYQLNKDHKIRIILRITRIFSCIFSGWKRPEVVNIVISLAKSAAKDRNVRFLGKGTSSLGLPELDRRTSALPPEADIGLNLPKRSANDPKRPLLAGQEMPD